MIKEQLLVTNYSSSKVGVFVLFLLFCGSREKVKKNTELLDPISTFKLMNGLFTNGRHCQLWTWWLLMSSTKLSLKSILVAVGFTPSDFLQACWNHYWPLALVLYFSATYWLNLIVSFLPKHMIGFYTESKCSCFCSSSKKSSTPVSFLSWFLLVSLPVLHFTPRLILSQTLQA